ncbi:MAG: 6-phosphogluconolactonase [Marmoricola sp.]
MTESEIRQHDDAEALADDVAERLLIVLADAQSAGRTPHLALTGGTIAAKIHGAVARVASHSRVDWGNVVIWWGDERFLAPDDPDRNAVQARSALLDAVDVDPANIHEMPSTADASSPDEGAASYSREMSELGAVEFDVVMLGVGPDGHVASLFPGSAQLDVDDRIAVGVTDSPKPPQQRISLTYPALNRTRAVWLVVSGKDKADAVARAVAGADLHDLPANGVHGRVETVWFLDNPAASHL